ncbi:unnamed protein product, partial [Closterium sp. NIES-54]
AQRTITLTQSHMVQQVLQCFDFTYSSPQATPLSTRHSLSALPSDESVEPSGPYPELVGCLMYLMTLCREHRLEHRTKHIALRYFLARELQQRGQLRLAYVASEANTADIFTKALPPGDHQRFCTLWGDFVIHPELALLCLTGLVTSCSPPLCLWGFSYFRTAGAGGTTIAAGPASTRTGGTRAAGTGGAAGAAGAGPAGGPANATGGIGADGPAGAGAAGATGAGAAGGVGAGGSAGAGASEGAGVGVVGARGATGAGAAARGTGAVPAGSGGAARPRPYFVALLEQVLGLPPSTGPAPPLACPQPVQSQSQLQPASPLPAPSPYTGPTGGLAERREPASRPASPVRAARTSRRAPRPRPPAVPGTHQMALRPSTDPLRVPLPSPPASSLPVLAVPESDSLCSASPTVTRLLTTVVTDPSFESTAASALVAELVGFAARCHLDYATSLVAESESVCPPSVGGESALSTDVLEDRQEEFQCFAAALPHLVSTLLAPEGDPDAPDIPAPRSYAEAIEGPYSSQWQAAMDAEMASWKSTGTYVDEVPPPGANIVIGMWIFRVKRPPGSPPVFKARYVARGFSQRQGVDYFQTFSPTSKMTTLRVLLHVAAQRDYELHSLDFSTTFL